jgi:hypothetical protein
VNIKILMFKGLNAALLAGVAASLVGFARTRLRVSDRAAATIALCGCLAIPMLVLSSIVMSETLFLALLLPALIDADNRLAAGMTTLRDGFVLGVAGGVLMLVRTQGLAFVLAVAVVIALQKNVRGIASLAAGAAAVIAPWQLWQWNHASDLPEVIRGDYGPYTSWLSDGAKHGAADLILRTVPATSRELFAMFAGLTTAGIPTTAARLLAVCGMLATILLGAVLLARTARVAVVFIAIYFAIVLVWPFTPSRFIWGIWPLIVVCFAAGALALLEWRPAAPIARAGRVVFAATVLLGVAGYGVYTMRGVRGAWWSSIPRSTTAITAPAIQWIARHTAPGAIVATNAEFMTYLYADRLAVPATRFAANDYFASPSSASRSEALRSILQGYRIDAVAIIANDSLEKAARTLAGAPRVLSLRDSVPGALFLTPVR